MLSQTQLSDMWGFGGSRGTMCKDTSAQVHENLSGLVQIDPKDTNIKVIIRNGHIVAGQETLPFKNKSMPRASNFHGN